MTATFQTMAGGHHVDLLNPKVEDISFPVICEHLAKINRYVGGTEGFAYSVAQHSVFCAKAALMASGDCEIAAYALCHDMHEAFLGDDATPKKRALAAIMSSFGVLSTHVADAFNMLTYRFDVVIHAAAGLSWPPPRHVQEEVKRWDAIMLATEWRDLMRCRPAFPFGHQPIPDVVVPWGWVEARNEMLHACIELLPRRFDVPDEG